MRSGASRSCVPKRSLGTRDLKKHITVRRRVRGRSLAMAHRSQHNRGARPGVVLLIVMAMLALFAVVGLSFVFYSESEREIARFNRQGANFDLGDALPE